jgi:hypothetical protein
MNNPLSLRLGLILLLLSTFYIAQAQLSLDWALTQGSKESDLTSSCNIDSEGRIYTVGVIRDTTDLDPGSDEDLLFPPEPEALVLSKFEANGSYIWGNRFVTNGEIGGHVTQLKDDELLMVIYFVDSLIYIHQGNSTNVTTAPGPQICILKIDTEGQITWVYNFQDKQNMYFSNLTSLEDGSFLAGGSFEGILNLSTPGGSIPVISNGNYDAFLARFDPSFNVQWITTMGGFGDDYVESIFSKDNETVYFAMVHDSTVFLSTDDGINTYPAFGEENCIYGIASLDGSGIQKAYSFGGALGDELRSIVADQEGNMYLCGFFEGTVNFQNPPEAAVTFTSVNESDGFVSKYDADGSLVWTRIFKDTEYGGLYTMSLERGNELYVTGSFSSSGDLDPGPDSNIVHTTYRGDSYAAKFDTDGNLKWAQNFHSNNWSGIRNLILDDTKVIIHGYHYDTLDSDPSENINLIFSSGGSDMFLMGFTEEGVISSAGELPILNTIIYPNPTTDQVTVTCESAIEKITVHTLNGSLLSVPVSINGESANINLRKLTPGIYLLKIKSGDQYSITRIVKE